jgi:hypothetical protein
MLTTRPKPQLPPVADLLEGVLLVPMGFVVGVTVFPGFLLTVPGLVLAGLFIALPLIAVALVVAAVGLVVAAAAAIVAVPRLAIRSFRARRELAPARPVAPRVATRPALRPANQGS